MQTANIVNGVDLGRLHATVEAVSADPTLARVPFRAGSECTDGSHNRTTIKGFYGVGQEDTSRTEPFVVDADEPAVLLGKNQAPNAGEYVLHALAACLTSAIVYHGAARAIVLSGLECTVEGDVDPRGLLRLDETVRPGYEQVPALSSPTSSTSINSSSIRTMQMPSTRSGSTSSRPTHPRAASASSASTGRESSSR